MHAKLKGNLAQTIIVSKLMMVGCNVFSELGDLSKIDLIAEYKGRLIRIQCKGVTPKNGTVTLHLKKSGPNYQFKYSKDQFDFFAVCNLVTGEVALISNEILDSHSTSLMLRINKAKNNQSKGTHNFSDFTDIQKSLENK